MNLRIVMQGPFNAIGGMIALTLEPSFNLASTAGELSSIRLPRGVTILSIAANTDLSSVNVTSDLDILPAFS